MAKTSFTDRLDEGDEEFVITLRGSQKTLEKITAKIFAICQESKVKPEQQPPTCRGCSKED